jgi:hypothetical protein
MSDHDATTVVGQLAGTDGGEQAEPITPERLIGRFCSSPVRHEGDAFSKAIGFCGYNGHNVDDAFLSGFDDGYDFMGHLGDRGWQPLHAKGDWPYVVYMAYRAREPYAIAEYCEADLTVWTFDSGEAAQAFYRELRDAP